MVVLAGYSSSTNGHLLGGRGLQSIPMAPKPFYASVMHILSSSRKARESTLLTLATIAVNYLEKYRYGAINSVCMKMLFTGT
ncbi:tick cistatins 1 [Echinococcus multilocularis]|uniref:Tick cistatins 1 n=1 Tax=Echinococcus multilocularis TaxID=6211 RepID=A0A0S4MM01_ECHMU|nr:tick cistatins 1 [Echinococcus multilocularis]